MYGGSGIAAIFRALRRKKPRFQGCGVIHVNAGLSMVEVGANGQKRSQRIVQELD